MGKMSELAILLRNGDHVGDLSDIARALGGEIDGQMVRMPSPGRPEHDRSCHVRVNPARPREFFIYHCEGSEGVAYRTVRAKLGLVELPSVDRTTHAFRIWEEGVAAQGTLVETYLRHRAISSSPPEVLRFHPSLRHGPSSSTWPAMIGLVSRTDGSPVAIHRTYLRPDGRGKAPVEPSRMSLGPIGGGVVRLDGRVDGLIVGEGIETCLSAMVATGRPAWSALSAVGLRTLDLPPYVHEVTVLADGDDAGESAALAAATRWHDEGRHILIARAPRGLDFNDVLMNSVLKNGAV